MTSSYRATSGASVRQTPASALPNAGAWSLDELAFPTPAAVMANPVAAEPAVPVVTPEMIAAEQSRLIDEGYARGLADGERRGIAQMQVKLNETAALVHTMVEQLKDVASLAPAVLEENVAALAVIVARQIVTREVTLDRELVAELVRRALTEFKVEESVRIRVNPLDLAMLSMGDAGTGPITANRDASWMADPRVSRGGCLIEGRERIVDGRVDTGLERAYRRMAEIDAS